ncbi:hypothetical protein [Brevundimonas sp. FT23042]|uniref:hypothetical protein n=1 Tax=Brevundimonas sp. FT23042 TaxID=3393749 RepID=UPI003B587EEF
MRKFATIVGALAITMGLASCGTFSNHLSPDRITELNQSTGYVILSAGAPDRCFEVSTALYMAPRGARYMAETVAMTPVDSYIYKSDYTDHHGKLSVLNLTPGRYQFYPVTLNPYVSPRSVPSFEFTVAAGEVVYLGEFFMFQSCALSTHFEVTNRESRDLPLLRQMNPIFETRPIITRIAKPDRMIVGGDR